MQSQPIFYFRLTNIFTYVHFLTIVQLCESFCHEVNIYTYYNVVLPFLGLLGLPTTTNNGSLTYSTYCASHHSN